MEEKEIYKNSFDSELALLMYSNAGYFYPIYDEDWGFFKSKLFHLTSNVLADISNL